MFRRVMRLGAAAVLLATLLVPAQAAYAADGCGDGWYKESDGYLTKDHTWQGDGNRNATIYHSGKVRFCTDNDFIGDDENRRALIGYPSDSYPFQSQVFTNGNYANFCVRQTIQVHMTGIKSSDSWSLSGSVSKDGPEVSTSYSATYDTLTVTIARTSVCDDSAADFIARTSGLTITADNESGKVVWVSLTTNIKATYFVNGTKIVASDSMTEHDYSALH